MSKVIPVTSPLLPPLEEFLPYLEQMWESRRLTNGGPFHEQLESALADYLGVDHLCLFANGTLALVTALQALRITGEVITTPYSFVATAHSLLWNDLTPVFVDIDPVTCNLDPASIDYLKNFGFADEVTVVAPGINGKMSEINAAFGLLQLKHIDRALGMRQRIHQRYREAIGDIPGLEVFTHPQGHEPNYSYFPILVTEGYRLSRDQVYALMREHDILARRYFYPLICEFPMYRGLPSADLSKLPVAKRISSQILCLPIYPDLPDEVVDTICQLLRQGG